MLLPGQRFDTVGVPPLIDGLAFDALIGDTAFDSNDIIADLNERGAKVVIAQHPRRTTPLEIDREMYKWRHLIENFFCKLKEFKVITHPPHGNVFMLSNQRLTPISSRCRLVSNRGRDTGRAASREAGLIASSGTLLA